MANNRLYIVDPHTGAYCCIAKAMGSGWYTTLDGADDLDDFLNKKNPETGKPIDWACSAGLEGHPTTLLLLDESQFDPGGMAADKRNIVRAVKSALRGDK